MTGLEESHEKVDRSLDVFFVGGLYHGVNVTGRNGNGDDCYTLPGWLDCSGISTTPRQYLKLIWNPSLIRYVD